MKNSAMHVVTAYSLNANATVATGILINHWKYFAGEIIWRTVPKEVERGKPDKLIPSRSVL